MRVLITGSNGFVGRNLASTLVQTGHQVTGLGRPEKSAVADIPYIQHDLKQPLARDISPDTFDTVVHCAALASPWASPADFHSNNVVATRHALRFAEESGVRHFIYISSSSIFYEEKDQEDLTEASPIPALSKQVNFYSRSKLEGEKLTQNFSRDWTILRPRAVFGPGDTVLLPRIVAAAKAGKLPQFIRRDGKAALGDLIYIGTLVDYIKRTIEGQVTGEFNLTNGEPVAIQEFVNQILGRLDLPTPRRKVPVWAAFTLAWVMEQYSRLFNNYQEPPVTRFGVCVFAYSKTFDIRRTVATLGPPSVSLADGIESLIEWWQQES